MPGGTSYQGGLREESLASTLAQGPLPLPFALHCATDVAAALRELYQEGRAHGEVSPASVVLRSSGASLLPPNGLVKGADSRADVAAFGAVLYQMLTGSKPPRGGLLAAPAERAPHAGSPGLRAAATRLAAKCLGASPDQAPTIQMVVTEVRLLNVLARQLGTGQSAVLSSKPVPCLAPAEPGAESRDEEQDSGPAKQDQIDDRTPSLLERCPKCGGREVHESHPRTRFESFVAKTGIPICRCHRCFHRYMVVWLFAFSKMPSV